MNESEAVPIEPKKSRLGLLFSIEALIIGIILVVLFIILSAFNIIPLGSILNRGLDGEYSQVESDQAPTPKPAKMPEYFLK